MKITWSPFPYIFAEALDGKRGKNVAPSSRGPNKRYCAAEGHKLDALRASDKACFTVIDTPEKEPDDWWYHVRSVICFGRVRVVEDAEEKDRRLRQLGEK